MTDDLDAVRGVVNGLILGGVFWALILAGYFLIRWWLR